MAMIKGVCWFCRTEWIYINSFSKLCKECERQIDKEIEYDKEQREKGEK